MTTKYEIMTGLDSLIAFTVVLFLLSVLAEKFSQLIRQYPRAFAIFTFIIGIYCSLGLLRESYEVACKLKDCSFVLKAFNIPLVLALCVYHVYLIYKLYKKLNTISNPVKPKHYLTIGSPLIVLLLGQCFDAFMVEPRLYLYFLFSTILLYFSAVALKIIKPFYIIITDKTREIRLFQKIKKGIETDDEGKAQEISLLTILVGVFIAFCFNIDPLDLASRFNQGPDILDFGWKEEFPFLFEGFKFRFETYEFDGEFALGLVLIGFFLSFGSRFFHDLLDRLYLAKKVKLASQTPGLLNQNSGRGILNFVRNFDVAKYYHEKSKDLIDQGLVAGLGTGTVVENNRLQKGIKIFNVGASLSPALIQELSSGRDDGALSDMPVEIIQVPDNNPAELTGISMSDAIFNDTLSGQTDGGQVTFPVINTLDPSNKYFLSCYHVVKYPTHSWDAFAIGSAHDQVTQGTTPIGEIVKASRTANYEVALIKQQAGMAFNVPFPPALQSIKGSRKVEDSDEGKEVFAYSHIDQTKISGRIQLTNCAYPIKFDKANYTMLDLICIKGPLGHIQKPGDSGGLLYDKEGIAIGILFARKYQHFSFAMRLQEVLDEFKLTLKI